MTFFKQACFTLQCPNSGPYVRYFCVNDSGSLWRFVTEPMLAAAIYHPANTTFQNGTTPCVHSKTHPAAIFCGIGLRNDKIPPTILKAPILEELELLCRYESLNSNENTFVDSP